MVEKNIFIKKINFEKKIKQINIYFNVLIKNCEIDCLQFYIFYMVYFILDKYKYFFMLIKYLRILVNRILVYLR